ncbi:helix-turn-helix domain-containing protein [Flavivirga rizhaonensis]|uniref:AraC family transcriptional regulator n=1 Tax=Flavivirga rizhaonensis TaxID=2559571 RepID=A0A4S1E3Q6_9FLAO|nr:helix-turn-helix domain-containing protein [Flavivirga rizhaonensis]TGV04678.1 AraC family transcriptional regulator [Flavivirga rizhaonensis]
MKEAAFILDHDLAPFVNCIYTDENFDVNGHTNIPLYADGYPGIMFQQTENDFFLLPKNKKLSELFLFGQTLAPVSLDVKGLYKFVVIQLYPFASKYLLGIDPKVLNDDCYDLLQIDYLNVESYRQSLVQANNLDEQVSIISDLMRELIRTHKVSENDNIEKAISIIIQNKGQIKIKDLLDKIYMTERTFERNFMTYIGLTPKQFSKIIQFQSSINKLTQATYNSLLDVGYDSGFSDQSHFIRTFKSYTGLTPSYYLNHLSNR